MDLRLRAKTRAVLMRPRYRLRQWNAFHTEEGCHINRAESLTLLALMKTLLRDTDALNAA